MDLKEIRWQGQNWIHLAQDRDQWRAIVKRVMNVVSEVLTEVGSYEEFYLLGYNAVESFEN
jgi:hypothetical protein